MPGVEAQANIIETILYESAIREVAPSFSVASALVLTLLAILAVWRFREFGLAVNAVLLVTIVGGTAAAFIQWNMWFRSAGVVLAVVAGTMAAVVSLNSAAGGGRRRPFPLLRRARRK